MIKPAMGLGKNYTLHLKLRNKINNNNKLNIINSLKLFFNKKSKSEFLPNDLNASLFLNFSFNFPYNK